LLAVCAIATIARAGTLHGTVNNGTTGKPGAGVDVVLIQLQGGMTPVATTRSDPDGKFTLENPGVGSQPMLVRAVYKGVNFHQPLPPGKESVTVEIFEPTQDAKSISVPSHVVIFQPNGSSLTVGEEYEVKNGATPAQAYYKSEGNFEVTLPEKADLKQIAASGPSGMPVVQAPIDKGKNRYAIAFAFRPGESDVRLSYDLPYPNNSTTVKLPTTFGGARLVVVAPPGVQLTGDGLTMAGQEQGMNIYERPSVDAGTLVSVALSGTAPVPSSVAGADGGGAPGRAENVQGGDGAQIQAIPGRLDSLKWPLIVGFCVLFVMAGILLARKPVAMSVPSETYPAAGGSGQTTAPTVTQQSSPAQNGDALAALDRATAVSLDALKDQLFRLELRRQAGTISEDNYAQERARVEQVLRELVRG